MDGVDLMEKLNTIVNKLIDERLDRQKNFSIKKSQSLAESHVNIPTSGCNKGNDLNNCMSAWEATMNGLARELETICSRGSSPRDSPNTSPCLTPTNGIANHSRRLFNLTGGGNLPHQGSLCEFTGNNTSKGVHQVRVRHEETEESLDQSLSIICRQNSSHATRFSCGDAEPVKGSDRKSARQAKLSLKDSMKYGIRFRLDLDGKDPGGIGVSINSEDHILRVFSDGEVIHLLQLAENTNPQTLSCMILDGAMLFIKQRSKEMMCLEYEGATEINLPITRQEESSLSVIITLRVPPGLSTEDVTVKTIDDTLMIRSGGSTSDAASACDVKFRVALKLPEGTDNRSVCAWVKKGQLTVQGRMVPASRRMTCAF